MKKEHVALVKRACRICSNTEDAEILLATKYYKGEPLHDLKPYHGQVIGFIEDGMCKKCKEKYKDKIVFIEIDESKSEDKNNPHRTGQVVEIKINSNFGKYLISNNLVKNNMAYITQEELENLKSKLE